MEGLKNHENERKDARSELSRYLYYFERFNNHEKSEKLARNLKTVIQQKIELLHQKKHYPIQELEFLN